MQRPASGPPTTNIYWPGVIWPAAFAVAVVLGGRVGGWQGAVAVIGGAGVGLALASAIRLVRVRQLLRDGARIEGTVVRVSRTKWTSDEGATSISYHRRVRFTTPNGRAVEFTSRVGTRVAPHEGQPVPVRYRADNPTQAEVDTAAASKGATRGIFLGLGLAILAVFFYLLLG